MRLRFITSTPLNIVRGSGTFAGITTLARFLRNSGATVDLVTPTIKFPIYTIERLMFNETLRFAAPPPPNSVTVGFDMDGYALPRGYGSFHIASIKGVIADELRFETGLTHATMRIQARCEERHVHRADLIIAPSRYSAAKIQELYSISAIPSVISEPIDLAGWRNQLQLNPPRPTNEKFTVLSVCRFYPRKRLHLLLDAADRLRSKIPQLEIRIVGDGPEAARLKSICHNNNLDDTVTWLGNLAQTELAAEYNRCQIFCLPSVQESFGIVFLEAMASGKPIVAANCASAPEVVKHGILVDPDDAEALAEGIDRLYNNPTLRETLATEASGWVQQFDAPRIAREFLDEIEETMNAKEPHK